MAGPSWRFPNPLPCMILPCTCHPTRRDGKLCVLILAAQGTSGGPRVWLVDVHTLGAAAFTTPSDESKTAVSEQSLCLSLSPALFAEITSLHSAHTHTRRRRPMLRAALHALAVLVTRRRTQRMHHGWIYIYAAAAIMLCYHPASSQHASLCEAASFAVYFYSQVTLKGLLESPHIRKLMFDPRQDSNALWHQYGVLLENVLCLQVAEVSVYHAFCACRVCVRAIHCRTSVPAYACLRTLAAASSAACAAACVCVCVCVCERENVSVSVRHYRWHTGNT